MKTRLLFAAIVGALSYSTTALGFESFEGYQAGTVLDDSTGISHMVSLDKCTDGEKALHISYDSGNQWNPLKVALSSTIDASVATHLSFDAINDSGVNANLLIKLADASGNDAWHWLSLDQAGAAAYSLDLSYIDGNNVGNIDMTQISVIDFGNADSADGAEVYIDNLRFSDGNPVVGAGCNQTAPIEPETPAGELRTEGGSLGVVGLLLPLILLGRQRKTQ